MLIGASVPLLAEQAVLVAVVGFVVRVLAAGVGQHRWRRALERSPHYAAGHGCSLVAPRKAPLRTGARRVRRLRSSFTIATFPGCNARTVSRFNRWPVYASRNGLCRPALQGDSLRSGARPRWPRRRPLGADDTWNRRNIRGTTYRNRDALQPGIISK